MPVSSKMKTALRSTLGGKGMDGAPFNAASQGGYRNMSKQIAGGAKMSARGLANAQQGRLGGVSQTPGFVPEQNQMQAAAGMALQRMSDSAPATVDAMAAREMGGGVSRSGAAPATVDAMAAREMGGGVSRSGAAAAQMAGAPQQRYDIANTGMLTAATPMVQAAAKDVAFVTPSAATNAGKLGMVNATPQVPTIDTSGAKYFGGGTGITTDNIAADTLAPGLGQRLKDLAALGTVSLPEQPQFTGSGENYGLPSLGEAGTPVSAATEEAINANRGRTADGTFGGFTPASDPRTTERMVEETIRDLLIGGVRDTTAEEQLAREMIQEQQQQALVDQRARAGRAGLVQTGAQAGIESDIRQKAAQQALAEIYGIQAGARGEQRADVGLAGQLYGMDKALAAEEARTAAVLEALKQMYGGTGQDSSYGPGSPGYFNQSPIQDSGTVASPYGEPLAAPPEGSRFLREKEYNGVVYDEYLGADGTSYLVEKSQAEPGNDAVGRRPFPRG